MALDEAARNLRLPYTYQIVEEDKGKQKIQQMIGQKASEIVEKLRDHFIDGAIIEWRKYREIEKVEEFCVAATGAGIDVSKLAPGSIQETPQEGAQAGQGTPHDSGIPSGPTNFELGPPGSA